jgi:hypothetical protein
MVRSRTPLSRIASISTVGTPQRPKPPDRMVMPSRSTPASAALASGYSFLLVTDLSRLFRGGPSPQSPE